MDVYNSTQSLSSREEGRDLKEEGNEEEMSEERRGEW